MVNAEYVPDRGDLVWLDFSPQSGHEQAGRRPALALSPATYNGRVGLALFCPITRQEKGYPFEVRIPPGREIQGVILSDQIRNLDWRARNASFVAHLPEETVVSVLQKAISLLRP